MFDRIRLWWKGLRAEENTAIEAVRVLYSILNKAPELAQRFFDLLPAILVEMKRLERALPNKGEGPTRLSRLTSWIEEEHGEGLQKIASISEIIAVTRAIATLVIGFLKASGMMQR